MVKDSIIRVIKLIDIGYIAAIYFVVALICAKIFEKFVYKEQEDPVVISKDKKWSKGAEVVGFIWLLGIVAYAVRNLVPYIPFPLDGYYGFDHHRVNELNSGEVFLFTFLLFQEKLYKQIVGVYDAFSQP